MIPSLVALDVTENLLHKSALLQQDATTQTLNLKQHLQYQFNFSINVSFDKDLSP